MTGQGNVCRPAGGKPAADTDALVASDLQVPCGQMLDLGQEEPELVAERIENLPGENAWKGEFRQELEGHLFEEPPEGAVNTAVGVHGGSALDVSSARDLPS